MNHAISRTTELNEISDKIFLVTMLLIDGYEYTLSSVNQSNRDFLTSIKDCNWQLIKEELNNELNDFCSGKRKENSMPVSF